MTTTTDWKALLTAQLECLEALSEDDIGTKVYVRSFLDDRWWGPYVLKAINDPTMTHAPFAVDGSLNDVPAMANYRFATKTLPIEPQAVTLIPWSGGECPVSSDTLVIVKLRKLWFDVAVAGFYTPYQWNHSKKSIYDHDIIAYRPITIDIEEG